MSVFATLHCRVCGLAGAWAGFLGVALAGVVVANAYDPELGEDTESRNDSRATAVWWNSARHARRAVPLTESECPSRYISYSAQSLLLVS